MLDLIACKLTFLIYLVNDVLDLKNIQQGCYVKKLERFNPQSTIKFVKDVFLD